MESYKTIVELSKSLVTCRYKADRAFLRGLIDNIYELDVKDKTPSKIAEIENMISKLSLKAGFGND